MPLRVALLQQDVTGPKDQILQNAVKQIQSAVSQHQPNLVILPESFNCPYDEAALCASAEEIPSGTTSVALRQAAIDCGMFIVGGSIVERSSSGQLYRKIHLGDSNASAERATVNESALFTAGDQPVTFDVGSVKIGLGICWDMRFPELAAAYRRQGCQLLIYPSLCDVRTGGMHWELIARSLALNNQLFVAFCSPARDEKAKLVAFGHSLVADPWGEICVEAGEQQEVVVADLNFDLIEELKIALIQLGSFPTKQAAIANALTQIRSAVKDKGAKLVILPECWNSTYSTEEFGRSAEKIPGGETSLALAKVAEELGIWLVGGTYPEVDAGKLYNTCSVFGPRGELVGKYRKMHLFDMDIPGICTFSESSVLTSGKEFLTFSVEGLKIGVGICYDQRFPEFAAVYRQLGVDFLIFPSAFDTYTGPMHFELIAQARALDNSMFVALCAPARDTTKDYVAYGYSTLCDPWGRVLCRAGEKPEILAAELDLTLLEDIKKKIPVLKQKRNDVYELVKKK
ncbi:hypothetical protein pipiens_016689 [Culex pipiens pipiens]|uniref:omega-amidase n=1 Tax=Culex pipiens pipiens TaxID=38569 RepID=A0ABD1CLH2_CULPP